MKVILTKEQELGEEGKIVNVAEGFGRNYLLPQRLAVEATPGIIKAWGARFKAIERRRAKEKEAWQKVAGQFADKTIEIVATASSKGKLFGAITAGKIVQALKDQLDLEVDKKFIQIPEPVKEVGEFKFLVKWASDVAAEVNLKITARPADAEA